MRLQLLARFNKKVCSQLENFYSVGGFMNCWFETSNVTVINEAGNSFCQKLFLSGIETSREEMELNSIRRAETGAISVRNLFLLDHDFQTPPVTFEETGNRRRTPVIAHHMCHRVRYTLSNLMGHDHANFALAAIPCITAFEIPAFFHEIS